MVQPCDALENVCLDALIHERKRRKMKVILLKGARMDEFMQKASNIQLPRHVLDFEKD